MKANLFFLFGILFLAHGPANAQLLAGEVPNGMSAMDLNYTINLTEANTTDSIALEFDCDDFHDAWAVLHRGAPEVDGPNTAHIRFLDDNVEVCSSLTPPSQSRPKYHAFGEPLDCAGDFDWQGVDEIVLGNFGGFMATGPVTIDSLYVAYKSEGQIGWILLSFDLQGNTGVSLTMHRILSICPGPLSVDDIANASGIMLFPNPGNGEPMRVDSAHPLRSIEVLDATGRIIAHHEGNLRTIPSPTTTGTYLVRATHADGQRSTQRWVRY